MNEYTKVLIKSERANRINNIMTGGVVFIAILIAYLFYALFWPVEVIEPQVQPYKVLTPVVRQGGELKYQVDICKYHDLPATIIRSFVIEGVSYYLPEGSSNVKVGCNKTDVLLDVPTVIPLGRGYLDIVTHYQINSYRTKSYHLKTDEFEVIK